MGELLLGVHDGVRGRDGFVAKLLVGLVDDRTYVLKCQGSLGLSIADTAFGEVLLCVVEEVDKSGIEIDAVRADDTDQVVCEGLRDAGHRV